MTKREAIKIIAHIYPDGLGHTIPWPEDLSYEQIEAARTFYGDQKALSDWIKNKC